MISATIRFLLSLVLLFVAASSTPYGQWTGPYTIGGPFNTTTVLNAPFSADAKTTITETRPDGTVIEHRITARHYRDSAGRVRVESDIVGQKTGQPKTFVVIHSNPADRLIYALDPLKHTYHRWPHSLAAHTYDSGSVFAIPVGLSHYRIHHAFGLHDPLTEGASETPLGSRRIEGISAVGRRLSLVDTRGVEVAADLWESSDLKVLLYSRISDPRIGVLEYHLTNVSRAEPPPNLFDVPPDYTELRGSAEPHSAHWSRWESWQYQERAERK